MIVRPPLAPLSRDGVNRLIAALREARVRVYGKDE